MFVGLWSLADWLLGCMVVFLLLLRVLMLIVVVQVLLLGVTGFGRILWFILISGCGLIWFLLLPSCSVVVILLLGVLVFLLILLGLMLNSARHGVPTFVVLGRETSLDEFNDESVGWFPHFDEFFLPALTGDMLFEVVKRKDASAGSLDGWGWRELKVLPVAWFGGLAMILTRVEELGVWPDGLPDAYITMIPKVDGMLHRLVKDP